MDPRLQDVPTSIGLLVLRLGIGGFMLTHGWGKLQMLLAGQFDQMGDPIGVGPHASLVLVTVAEFLCPILLILGLATRVAAIPIVIAMGVAAFVAHKADPWTMSEAAQAFFAGTSKSLASKEPALLFLIPALALAFTGAGRFSVAALLSRRWAAKP